MYKNLARLMASDSPAACQSLACVIIKVYIPLKFVTDCKCLGGVTGVPTTSTPAPCEDMWKAKKCKKMKKKGKCGIPKVDANCKKTCGILYGIC